jgi:hypothetical protein
MPLYTNKRRSYEELRCWEDLIKIGRTYCTYGGGGNLKIWVGNFTKRGNSEDTGVDGMTNGIWGCNCDGCEDHGFVVCDVVNLDRYQSFWEALLRPEDGGSRPQYICIYVPNYTASHHRRLIFRFQKYAPIKFCDSHSSGSTAKGNFLNVCWMLRDNSILCQGIIQVSWKLQHSIPV